MKEKVTAIIEKKKRRKRRRKKSEKLRWGEDKKKSGINNTKEKGK